MLCWSPFIALKLGLIFYEGDKDFFEEVQANSLVKYKCLVYNEDDQKGWKEWVAIGRCRGTRKRICKRKKSLRGIGWVSYAQWSFYAWIMFDT